MQTMLLFTRGAVCATRFLNTCCQKTHILQSIQPEISYVFCRSKITPSRKPQRFRPLHAADNVSKDYSIIYVNNLLKTNYYAQIVIYSLSVPTMIWSAYLCAQNYQDIPFKLTSTSPALGGMLYLLFNGFLVLALNFIGRRSIHRMYHNPDTDHYIAIVQNWNMVKGHLAFTADEARYQKPSLMNGFLGNLEIKGRQFFVVGTDFKQPAYYNRLMGWDVGTPLEQASDIDLKELIHKARKKS
ncbi:uncharacterized protein LOC121388537 [Gigantopelta aegis]|uniref:uncharacterized protein LOC121388537 n=1 Tax=Gigantopelta aegis TaxID=1735272 RepID=UPI001B88D254|nr:uncharacterized protein LOC121388537 [Gigantopelta aegis]XP_041375846.1 uncharacterized protein LOC121388537 [Gigantopelta aegis]XP_041375847.1 uncharacterized protein LOC121388537 [Gigantopelta aegis]